MFISIHWAFASILELGFAGLRRIGLGSAAASRVASLRVRASQRAHHIFAPAAKTWH